jgi:hypothetical protein
MSEFLGDLAFMFEIYVLGLGLVVLHFNKREPSVYLRWSGRLMTVFGVVGLVCTGFFYMKYFLAGEFDHAYHMGIKSSYSSRSHSETGNVMPGMNDCLGQIQGKMMNDENMNHAKICMAEMLNGKKG